MVLVTGGADFLSTYLIKYLLKQGQTVRVLRNFKPDASLLGTDAEKVEWVDGDVLDLLSLEAAFQGITKVYHTGSLGFFDKADKDRLMKVNIEGTANVVNAALAAGVEKLLHLSSAAALGEALQGEQLDETTTWDENRFYTTYGESRLLGEMEVWRGIAEGLNAVIVNPTMMLGATYREAPEMFWWRKISNGLRTYPNGTYGAVDVRDVAKVMVQLMDSEVKNERFIISAENISFRELLSRIAQATDRKQPQSPMNGWEAFADRVKNTLSPGFESLNPSIHALQKHFAFNNEKLRNILKEPLTPIEQTIKETAELWNKASAPSTLAL